MPTLNDLDQRLYLVSDDLIEDIASLRGDILILGAGGKMGPGLAKLARKAVIKGNLQKRIIAVSRFSDTMQREELANAGIEIIAGDLMDDALLERLPDVDNVIYMAGTKFGTTGNEHLTWAMNVLLPGKVASRFRHANIVVFSTGNVYPLFPVDGRGPDETSTVGPVGEYAQSCLGRERMFEYFSRTFGTRVLIYRLNYAIDLRYGVLLEIAKAVKSGSPIDLSMGYVNVIWQGDANAIAIRCLRHCGAPPQILNVTGKEAVSVRWLAEEFGRLLDHTPVFKNEELPTALISDASRMEKLFSFEKVTTQEMISMTVAWLQLGGELLNKPTHFQERDGKF